MSEQIVLLIENDSAYADVLQTWLPEESLVIRVPLATDIPKVLDEQHVDVILADITTTQLEELRRTHNDLAISIPVVILTTRENEASVANTLNSGVPHYLVKEDLTAAMLNNVLHDAAAHAKTILSQTPEQYEQQIERLEVLQHIDRELGYTLNSYQVVDIAIDTALRLTGAGACVVGWIEEDIQQLRKLGSIGKHQLLTTSLSLDQIANSPTLAKALQSGKYVLEPSEDGEFFAAIFPLMLRGQPAGVLCLENIRTNLCCDQADYDFLTHLVSSTAVALDKTRIYQQARRQVAQMEKLYELSTDISRGIDRNEVMTTSLAAVANLLEGSSAFFCEYKRSTQMMIVRHRYVSEGTADLVAPVDTAFNMERFPTLLGAISSKPLQIHQHGASLTDEEKAFTRELGVHAALLVPLLEENTLLGMMVVCVNRIDRHFTPAEIALARSLAGSTTVALNKATLFANVQQLEQVKSEMIRMASHDLRTPLSRIVFSTAIMEMENDPGAEQNEFLTTIKEAAQQMHELLEDMLNLERIESPEANQMEPLDATALIEKVCGHFRQHAHLNDQEFVVEIPATPISVVGSALQLQQAYSNFISNALKYTPKGGRVTVRAAVEGRQLKFEVEDTGYGIPPERQVKIFNRFYRAHAPGTEAIPGTGLGLSLVKTVIERHGGEVWFRSQLNVGSVFGCWIPLAESA